MIAILRPDIKRLEAQIAAAREQDPAATDWDIFVDTGLAEIWEMDATYPEERLHIWVRHYEVVSVALRAAQGLLSVVVPVREDGYGCILRLWRWRLPRAGAGNHTPWQLIRGTLDRYVPVVVRPYHCAVIIGP